ncbi:homospermidine synthase [Methylohalobius crimeensis]|uniref:homospermidine synthase n=1 Tax=Methylohalobius crimeensis TaxID=244365 RepID=UPI0003B4E455|nr:homospermidine synthase [Methylohalobius crimeensis]
MGVKVLVLGYGNPGRGDDGLGPALVERLESRFESEGRGTLVKGLRGKDAAMKRPRTGSQRPLTRVPRPSLDADSMVTWLTAMQLQPEHILDMEQHDLTLLADAGWETPAPFTFEAVQPLRDSSFTTHALSPQTLLAIYRDTLGGSLPPTFLLTLRGERFGLGETLSSAAAGHLDAAAGFVAERLSESEASAWRAACTGAIEEASTSHA